jgi:endonuclease YncB( thermonuclease family)
MNKPVFRHHRGRDRLSRIVTAFLRWTGYVLATAMVLGIGYAKMGEQLPSLLRMAADTLEIHLPAREPFTAPVAADPAVAVGEMLAGDVISVSDGDTFTLLVDDTRYRIRLAEIDTPEKDQAWSTQARQALAGKVYEKHVTVQLVDTDRHGRLVAKAWLGDRDINREMVRDGHAWVYQNYLQDRSLLEDEAAAKQEAVGIWSQPTPIPPWIWRGRQFMDILAEDSVEESGSPSSEAS